MIRLARIYGVTLDDLVNLDKAVEVGAPAMPQKKEALQEPEVPPEGKTEQAPPQRNQSRKERLSRLLQQLPVGVIVTLIYLYLGFVQGAWHPWWILFLIIPVYYMVLAAAGTKKSGEVAVGVTAILVTCVFLWLGFSRSLWNPAWTLFLLVPLAGGTVSAIGKRKISAFPYPILVAMVYLILGAGHSLWHPGWLVFLTIPIFYPVAEAIDRGRADE